MASQWIITFIACLLLGDAIHLASAGRTDSQLVEESGDQLELLLKAINELERQRLQENTENWSHKADSAKQRPNSKRLRWNRRRSGAEGRGFGAYSSSISYPPNPDYINVKDYEPTPAPWWFNIN
ncbi:hypothetical protein KR032_001682 [Drosophila birchii]|nr:hypothetical protein KR032_001682 [Drosophila birchii]